MEGLEYKVSLADHMSGPATVAAKSVSSLSAELARGKKDLAAYQSQLSLAKATGNIAGFQKYSALVDDTRRHVFGLAQSLEGVAPKMTFVESVAAKTGLSVGAVGMAAGAAVAGVAALGGALAAIATVSLRTAIEQASLRRELVAGFEALGGYAGAGEKTVNMVNDMARVLPQTREELAGWTRSFMELGVTDLGQLRSQLSSTANAVALGGKEGGAAYMDLSRKIQFAIETSSGLKIAERRLESLSKTGVDIADVANKMGVSQAVLKRQLAAGTVNAVAFGNALQTALQAKGKGPLAQMSMEFGVMFDKAKSNFSKLFENVNIGPLMASLKKIFDMFDDTTASGKVLKDVITNVMDFRTGGTTKMLDKIRYGIKEVIIWSLRTAIFIKEHWSGITRAFKLAAVGVALVTAAFVLYSVAAGVAAIATFVVASPFLALGAALVAAGVSLYLFWDDLVDMAADFVGLGVSMAKGLVKGLMQGIQWVKDAASGLVGSIKSTITGEAEVHSPSRVTQEYGANISEGMAIGMTAKQGQVRASATNVSDAAMSGMSQQTTRVSKAPTASAVSSMPPSAPVSQPISPSSYAPKQPAQRAAKGTGGGATINGGIRIEMTAPDGVTNALELTEIAVASLFERIALMQGA